MVQTEAQKRAKAKYYAKLRENEEYKKNMAQRTRDYYQQNKEKHREHNKNYYQQKKREKLLQDIQEKENELVNYLKDLEKKQNEENIH